MYSKTFTVLTLVLLTSVSSPVLSKETDDLTVKKWLHLGPVTYHNPAYHDVPDISGEKWSAQELLGSDIADYPGWKPEAGKSVAWTGSQELQWTVAETDDNRLALPGAAPETHNVNWYAVYVTADRWTSGTLTLKSPYMLRAFLNSDEIISKTSLESGEDDKPGTASHNFELKKGTHLLLVKTLHPDGDHDAAWDLKAKFDAGDYTGSVSTGISASRFVKLRDLSDAPRPAGVSVSPDGDLAAVHVRQDLPPDGTPETRIDIRKTSNGELYRRYAGGMQITGMQWVPHGRKFSYTSSGQNGTDLWVVDLDSGEKTRILRDVEDFAGYQWSPDASYVIYSKTKRHEPGKHGVMRYHGLQDRRPGYHDRTFLYQLHVPEGTTRRLTSGKLSTALSSIHPDGDEILFVRFQEVYDERPFGKTEYVTLNLTTMETDSLFTINFGGAAQYSPDGGRILITAGPKSFGPDGIDPSVPDSLIPNDYDTQAYIYHRENGEIEPITREFDPAIESASWDDSGRYIYFVVTEKAYRTIHRYDTRRQQYRKYETGPDVIGSLSLARNTPVGVFTGSGASDTPKTYTIDFTRRSPEASVLYDPGSEAYQNVSFGDVTPWTFTNNLGEEIDGHVYFPPDFDESKSYPVIVYYYAGTVPVSRNFGGRYPKELYASKGYVVYVMQPSGATGFGQEFSARHVNDWGKMAGDEIIKGVSDFLDAHSWADRERVGAIGASYGGFMTMYLLTRTDLFAAAVSHAGISNLTSYWGEGFWGYQYSGVATANSYPWNRQDIYVDRSPVFQADNVSTPLLLVTGMDDTNVPAGESLQMFTALKILGKDVAFIAIDEQDHHILDYNKYILWKEVILSWFDKWLKEEPQWWQETHGK